MGNFCRVGPKRSRPVVMLDIDGVLRDFHSSWQAQWRLHFGRDPHYIIGSWNAMEQAGAHEGLSPQESLDLVFRRWGWSIMSGALPYPSAKEAVKFFWYRGWRVVLGTHQDTPEIQRATKHWVKEWEIPYDLMVFTDNKASIKADVYVEDKAETLLSLAGLYYPGSVIVRISRPWNESKIIPSDYRFQTYRGVDDLLSKQLYYAQQGLDSRLYDMGGQSLISLVCCRGG